jgi:acetyl esterase/lipase
MLIRTIVNAGLRHALKPLWNDIPSVPRMRATYLRIDRLGTLGRPPVRVDVADVGGVTVEWIGRPDTARDGVILYLHGGGFAVRAAAADRRYCAGLARRTGRPVVLVPYRLAPECPFPAGLDDCCAVYAGLLAAGIPAHKIVVIGHSAGANLALVLLMRARDKGWRQPAGCILLSAPIDLTAGSPSASANAARDSMQGPNIWPWVRMTYLGAVAPDHPDVSPLFGDWAGLAPLHFHVSDTEIILDDSRRAAERARAAGNRVALSIWHDVPHSFYYMYALREAWRCRGEVVAFVTDALRQK